MQLYGSTSSSTGLPKQLLTVDRTLCTVQQVIGQHPNGFAAVGGAYRLPDQAMLFYGWATRRPREGDRATGSYVSTMLADDTTWIFAEIEYFDYGTVYGACLPDEGSQLVVARDVTARSSTAPMEPR